MRGITFLTTLGPLTGGKLHVRKAEPPQNRAYKENYMLCKITNLIVYDTQKNLTTTENYFIRGKTFRLRLRRVQIVRWGSSGHL